MSTVTKADLTTCAERYAAITRAVTLPAGTAFAAVDTSSTTKAVPTTVTLRSLQSAIRAMETLFSGNCNCLTNTNCCQRCESTRCQSSRCQSCQSTTCQSVNQTCQSVNETCQSCQKSVCQSCQTAACQSCQREDTNCNCNCDCECNDGA